MNKSIIFAFWLMGLFNNASYVVMIAGAKSISEGGTGMVFLMDVLPALLMKLSAPYWFHLVDYKFRIYITACLFMTSFCTVGFFAHKKDNDSEVSEEDVVTTPVFVQGMELIGVGFTSLGGGLGEASLLALAGFLDVDSTGSNITAFSSGTGVAGLFGFLWNAILIDWIGLSFTASLLVANVLAFTYVFIYKYYLNIAAIERQMEIENEQPTHENEADEREGIFQYEEDDDDDNENDDDTNAIMTELVVQSSKSFEDLNEENNDFILDDDQRSSSLENNGKALNHLDIDQITAFERLRLVASLWPYMIPLFAVYFAEYALQSGPWTAIGFPVTDAKARNEFYKYANWLYQGGVFLSRSSGAIFQASLRTLWILPGLQLLNLLFFTWTATTHVWYNWSLLFLCFGAGLLGGGVYVNAYNRINVDIPKHQKEFSLASASVADSVGTVMADVMGIFIQSCLYLSNGISGAAFSCPLRNK